MGKAGLLGHGLGGYGLPSQGATGATRRSMMRMNSILNKGDNIPLKLLKLKKKVASERQSDRWDTVRNPYGGSSCSPVVSANTHMKTEV